jgi:hypothetical protein
MKSSVKTVKLQPTWSPTLYALYLSDDNNAICAKAFHGIFLTLKTMLSNEVTRAETINLRAMNYWHHHVIPDPPRHPASVG